MTSSIPDKLVLAGMHHPEPLPAAFYLRADVVTIAKELIAKVLVTNFDNQLTAGRIVETEAYNGPFDKAAHSYNNRRTKRTEVMYAPGGVAYVYLCYGIHQMFNIVTNVKDVPNAILVRAVEPMAGIDLMLRRCKKITASNDLTRGPGNVGRALGFHTGHSGMSLLGHEIMIIKDDFAVPDEEIVTSTRIGVDYAAEDTFLPYRFFLRGNQFVSGRKTRNDQHGTD